MSCDHRRRTAFQALVAAGRSGGLSADELETCFQAARTRPPDASERPADRERLALKTRQLFHAWNTAGFALPTHSATGLPRVASQRGYAAILDVINAHQTGAAGAAAPHEPVVRRDDAAFVAARADNTFPTGLTAPALLARVTSLPPAQQTQALVHVLQRARGQLRADTLDAVTDGAAAGVARDPALVPTLAAVGVSRCDVCGRWQSSERGHTCVGRRLPAELPQELRDRVAPALAAIRAAGGRPLLVGGAVRDLVEGRVPKDADIEVYGIDPDALQTALGRLGPVNAVGKSFGVLKVRMPDGDELDVSIPRRENKTGAGHRGFLVEADPTMTVADAAARRDFTWNAMAYDPDTHTIIDPCGGLEDLRNGIIRHVSPAFAEDPLRVLRAMQFAARFAMQLAPETAALCRTLLPEAAALPKERRWGEFEKLVLKGKHPAQGVQVLADSGWLAAFPQLQALDGVPQDTFWHPEGDVLVHTQYVVNAAAQIADRDQLDDHDRTVLVLAALCHDLAKPATTATKIETAPAQPDGSTPPPGYGPAWQPDGRDGYQRTRITSYGHEEAGAPLARALLTQIGAPERVIAEIEPLVRLHLQHIPLVHAQRDIEQRRAAGEDVAAAARDLDKRLRRLAVACAPASFAQLGRLIAADMSGRPPLPPQDPVAPLVARATQLGSAAGAPKQMLLGRDLIHAGLKPGPGFTPILDAAYEAQLDGAFSDSDDARVWLATYLSTAHQNGGAP